jgi:hypothetical protein
MLPEVDFAPEVELDIAEAYIWYLRAGRGEELLVSIDACIGRIRRWQLMYQAVSNGYRRAVIRKCPYALFYKPTADLVTVRAFFHTSRDPETWRKRLM